MASVIFHYLTISNCGLSISNILSWTPQLNTETLINLIGLTTKKLLT